MQPILMIRSDVPGVVYINGRFAGEAGDDQALSIPVSSRGTLYVELRPIADGFLPITRRIALSKGEPVPACLEGQSGAFLVHWPGAVLDLTLCPAPIAASPPPQTQPIDSASLEYSRAQSTARLSLHDGDFHPSFVLERANPPAARRLRDGLFYFEGELDDGERYAMVVSPTLDSPLLLACGEALELLPDGAVRALTQLNDPVGHAQLCTYRSPAPSAPYEPINIELLWAHGAPRWPNTAEETAIAALWAARLGLHDELLGYFAMGSESAAHTLCALVENCHGCVRLKYPLPSGESAVGILSLASDNIGRVTPIAYRATMGGGSQGPWRLTSIAPLSPA